jgi:hypothetical protein
LIVGITPAIVVSGALCLRSALWVWLLPDGCFGTLTAAFLRSLEQGQSTRFRLIEIISGKSMFQYSIGAVVGGDVTLAPLHYAISRKTSV